MYTKENYFVEYSEESKDSAEVLLKPAYIYLSAILDAEKNKTDRKNIEQLEEKLKQTIDLALEHRFLLYP